MGGHGVLECFDNFITTTWQFPYLLNKNSKMWKWTIDYKIVKNRFDISWTHALCLSVWSNSWKLKLPGIFQPFINEILSVFLLICPCKSHKIKCALLTQAIIFCFHQVTTISLRVSHSLDGLRARQHSICINYINYCISFAPCMRSKESLLNTFGPRNRPTLHHR